MPSVSAIKNVTSANLKLTISIHHFKDAYSNGKVRAIAVIQAHKRKR